MWCRSKNKEVPEAQLKACPASKPTTTQACPPTVTFCEDVSRNFGCSGHGKCNLNTNKCDCFGTWGGPLCAVDTSTCMSGTRDVNNDCCTYDVLDKNGKCCSVADTDATKPSVDWKGKCCAAGYVDPCGVCGGSGFARDLYGTCCPVRACLAFASGRDYHQLAFVTKFASGHMSHVIPAPHKHAHVKAMPASSMYSMC